MQPNKSPSTSGAKVSSAEILSYPRSLIALAGKAVFKSFVTVKITETIFVTDKLFFSNNVLNKIFEDSNILSSLFSTEAIAPLIPIMTSNDKKKEWLLSTLFFKKCMSYIIPSMPPIPPGGIGGSGSGSSAIRASVVNTSEAIDDAFSTVDLVTLAGSITPVSYTHLTLPTNREV